MIWSFISLSIWNPYVWQNNVRLLFYQHIFYFHDESYGGMCIYNPYTSPQLRWYMKHVSRFRGKNLFETSSFFFSTGFFSHFTSPSPCLRRVMSSDKPPPPWITDLNIETNNGGCRRRIFSERVRSLEVLVPVIFKCFPVYLSVISMAKKSFIYSYLNLTERTYV